ncbi:MAG: hypothetical protein QM734_04405 [Cyclobacteriaceae bacterium]
MSANVFILNSVIVNNFSTNTSAPGAIYNYIALNSPSPLNVYLYGSIVALNTYKNPASPKNGLKLIWYKIAASIHPILETIS